MPRSRSKHKFARTLLLQCSNHYKTADKNIPHVIAWGFVLLGIGNLLFSMPHFLTDEYVGGDKVTDICPLEDACGDQTQSNNLQPWIVVFIIAQMLHGIGSTPLYTLGFSFLEDSTKR